MRGKRAQGALEFLMTYGWAFLVILIMIGALAYFGVLNPTKFLPERCQFGSQMACKDYKMSNAGPINLRLQNNIGNSIAIEGTSVTALDEDGDPLCAVGATIAPAASTASPYTLDFTATVIPEGDTFLMDFSTCTFATAGASVGSKFKVEVELSYYDPRSGPTFDHTLSGEIFATIEE